MEHFPHNGPQFGINAADRLATVPQHRMRIFDD
jgi:hypothetical protein